MNKFLPKTTKNPQGFTLIELMVVVSIIAILSVVGVTVFNSVQKNARDARRKADVESISKAYEQSYAAGSYPLLTATSFAGGAVPLDPTNTAPLVYSYLGGAAVVTPPAAGATYLICAKLENTTGGNSSDAAGVAAANGGFFCRKNQQ